MESFREQRCRACLGLFYICSCCDHGQVYCGDECQTAARDAQVRKARRKYLADEDVREGERQRQRDRRARVRDQGSREVAPSVSVPIDAARPLMDSGGDRAEGHDHASQEYVVGAMRRATAVSVAATEPIRPAPTAEFRDPARPERPIRSRPVLPCGRIQPASAAVQCAFCGRRTLFVRFGPLRRGRPSRWYIRARAP
jgi:hypothetical protein